MQAQLSHIIQGKNLDYFIVGLIVLSSCLAVGFYNPLPLLIPIAFLGLLLMLIKPYWVCAIFFMLLPFSIEVDLPGGYATDLPSEPLMLVLTGLTLLFLLSRIKDIKGKYFNNPVTVILVLHIAWILITVLFSTHPFFSIKFFLAKIWYVFPFYFLPFYILQKENKVRLIIQLLIWATAISITYVMFRHAMTSFSFASINKAVRPIYRNHVNYGIMLVLVLPYVYYIYKTSTRLSKQIYLGLLLYFLAAIYLTYTRAAQLSIVLAIAIYFVVKLKLVKASLTAALAAGILLVAYMSWNNNYLDFAPEYSKAVEHKKFDNLVEATYKMEDISTVERFYRWVAGIYMIKEKPLTGFGPSTFYSEYKSYTVTSYKTYVSQNPEKSGVHNYYLMTAIEQGVLGLIIFIAFIFLVLVYGEQAYYAACSYREQQLVMASIISFTIICIVILINDLIEADKVGPFFFLAASIITIFYQNHKEKYKNSTP